MKVVKRIAGIVLAITILLVEMSVPMCVEAAAPRLKVTYPSTIKCGEPTTFTMNVENGTGTYKYMSYSLNIQYRDGSQEMLVDVSRNGGYKDDNTFTFTFYASGIYKIRFIALNMQNYSSVRSDEYTLNIQDSNYP